MFPVSLRSLDKKRKENASLPWSRFFFCHLIQVVNFVADLTINLFRNFPKFASQLS